jgi:nitrogen regulatory protein P-II 1
VVDFLPKIAIQVVVSQDRAEEVVNTIRNRASTGSIGDGKIFVSAVEQAVRIRTGETGEDSL